MVCKLSVFRFLSLSTLGHWLKLNDKKYEWLLFRQLLYIFTSISKSIKYHARQIWISIHVEIDFSCKFIGHYAAINDIKQKTCPYQIDAHEKFCYWDLHEETGSFNAHARSNRLLRLMTYMRGNKKFYSQSRIPTKIYRETKKPNINLLSKRGLSQLLISINYIILAYF